MRLNTVLVLFLILLLIPAVSLADEASQSLTPIVRYDFSDAEDLGHDACGIQPLEKIGNVTRGTISEGVYSAVFDGSSALVASPMADRDVTDILTDFTITLWGKHPSTQPYHSFMLGTGVAYSSAGFGMGFYMGNEAFIVPMGGISDGAYAVNYRFPNETKRYATPTEWNLFALSVHGDTAAFSVNGEVFNAKGITNTGLTLQNLGQIFTLGGVYNNDHDVFYNGFKGELADVRVYSCALTGDQLTALHDMGPCGGDLPSESPVITAVTAPDLSDLTVYKRTTPSEVLSQLDAYPISFTTDDGVSHDDGYALWTNITKTEEGYTVEGRVVSSEYPNPQNLSVSLQVPFGASRSIQLPSVFSNNMVLQRGEDVRIFGAGGAQGDTLTVAFAGQTVEAVFSENAWEATLAPMEACAVGQTMTITYMRKGETTPYQVFTLENVLVGEVWLCSGQSNMAYTIAEMLANPGAHPNFYADYQKIDNWDMMRFYTVTYAEASEPQNNYNRMLHWQAPTSIDQCRSLSGLALAYAAHLQTMLGEDVPVGMVISSVGGACIEEWLDQETMADLPSHAASMGKKDCRFYNAMIHPLEGYTVKGILWYQGEANVSWPEDYQEQFAAYAEMYREKFHNAELPIIMMQLPQYDWDSYIEFRTAQWELMDRIDNVYVVCGIDLGDPDNIHPTDKYPFAQRAAGVALEKVYGLAAVEGKAYGLSPCISNVRLTDEGILISVSNAQSLTGSDEIEGFMVMADRRWYEVSAQIVGNQILVSCDRENITYISYLQDSSFPDMEFVYNEYGLPLAPLPYTKVK